MDIFSNEELLMIAVLLDEEEQQQIRKEYLGTYSLEEARVRRRIRHIIQGTIVDDESKFY